MKVGDPAVVYQTLKVLLVLSDVVACEGSFNPPTPRLSWGLLRKLYRMVSMLSPPDLKSARPTTLFVICVVGTFCTSWPCGVVAFTIASSSLEKRDALRKNRARLMGSGPPKVPSQKRRERLGFSSANAFWASKMSLRP